MTVDLGLFSPAAAMKAAYKFTDRVFVFLSRSPDDPGTLIAVLTSKAADRPVDDQLAGEFANELLDQRIRETLDQKFGDLRTLIVAQAFSEGNLLDVERDEGDYQRDPRGAGRRR